MINYRTLHSLCSDGICSFSIQTSPFWVLFLFFTPRPHPLACVIISPAATSTIMSHYPQLMQREGSLSRVRGAAMQPQGPPQQPSLVGASGAGCIVAGGSLRSQEAILSKTLHRNTQIQNYLHFNTTISCN